MREEAGGAAGSRGFRYQEIAAAYFSLTDFPNFLSQLPSEVHIEQYSSDFAFSITKDDYDEEHFFEAKYRSTGAFELTNFRSIFNDFESINHEHANDGNSSSYHLVTNASLGRKLKSLKEDATKIRRGITTWDNVSNKAIYTHRGDHRLLTCTEYDDVRELVPLIRGTYIHSIDEGYMKGKLEDYIRACNSPGNSQKLTAEVLQKFHEKDEGVISRVGIDEEIGLSLRRNNDSTSSSSVESTGEIAGGLVDLADDFSSSDPASVEKAMEAKELTTKFSKRVSEDTDVTSSVEMAASSLLEDTEQLIDLKSEAEQIENSIEGSIDRLISLSDVESAAQEGGTDSND